MGTELGNSLIMAMWRHEHGKRKVKMKDNSTYTVFHHSNLVRTSCNGKSMCDK